MSPTGSVRGNVWGGAGRNGANHNGAGRNGAGPHAGAEREPVGYLRSVPDLASAIRRKSASFSHVALAYLFGREGRGPDGEAIPHREKQLCRDHFPDLLEAYERQHGHICKSFFGRHAFVAAAITAESRPAEASTTTTKRGGVGDWPSAWNTNPATNSATTSKAFTGEMVNANSAGSMAPTMEPR